LALFYLWTPITDVFFNGAFHSNVDVQIQADSVKLKENKNLLAIHVLVSNKGKIPVDITDKNAFILEIRKIDDQKDNEWTDVDKLKKINRVSLLRNIQEVPKGKALITFEPNSDSDQTESIALSNGVYWVHARLDMGNPKDDGDFFEATEIIKVPTQ